MSDNAVPVTNPAKPMMNITAFLTIFHLFPPLYTFQNSKVSMNGGASKARAEELSAPTSEMNKSSRGIIAANMTARECKVRLIIEIIVCFHVSHLLTSDENEDVSKGKVNGDVLVHYVELPRLCLCERNQDFEGDVKLYRVCEEDGDREHDDDHLGQSEREFII